MDKSASQSTSKPILNRGFLVTLGILAVIAAIARPSARWVKAQYDTHRANNTSLTASENKYKELLQSIEANQPNKSVKTLSTNGSTISEKIFQTALLPDILGRSSRYEPYTSNGTLACARMVNMAIDMGPRETIKRIRSALKGAKYQNSKLAYIKE